MKKNINSFLGIIFLGVLSFTLMSQTGGCGASPTPTSVAGSFQTGVNSYNCATGSPASLTKANVGKLMVNIVSDNPPQFNYNYLYTYQDATIDCGFYANCCVTAKFPQTDSYTATLWYIELGQSYCQQPGAKTCFRWYRQNNYNSGFLPSCDNSSIIINQMDPNGFVGQCG